MEVDRLSVALRLLDGWKPIASLGSSHPTPAVRWYEAKDAGCPSCFPSPHTAQGAAVALVGLLGPCHSPSTSEILTGLALMVSLAGWHSTHQHHCILYLPLFPGPSQAQCRRFMNACSTTNISNHVAHTGTSKGNERALTLPLARVPEQAVRVFASISALWSLTQGLVPPLVSSEGQPRVSTLMASWV